MFDVNATVSSRYTLFATFFFNYSYRYVSLSTLPDGIYQRSPSFTLLTVSVALKKNYRSMEMPSCGASLSGDDLGFRADVRRSLT